MKAGMIDTNILLHAVNSDSEDHDAAVRFLDSVAGGPAIFYLTVSYTHLTLPTN